MYNLNDDDRLCIFDRSVRPRVAHMPDKVRWEYLVEQRREARKAMSTSASAGASGFSVEATGRGNAQEAGSSGMFPTALAA